MALIIAVVCLTPPDEHMGVVTEYIDRVEVNHVYDDKGRPTLSQIIFYETIDTGYRVRDWRLWGQDVPHDNPFIFFDGEVTRKIYWRVKCETWTQHDVEIQERSVYPKCYRRTLVKPRQVMKPNATDLQVNDDGR